MQNPAYLIISKSDKYNSSFFEGNPSLAALKARGIQLWQKYQQRSWATITEFSQFVRNYSIVSRKLMREQWSWHCHCFTHTREHVCSDVLAIQLLRNEVVLPAAAVQFQGRKKRRAGAPKRLSRMRYGPVDLPDLEAMEDGVDEPPQDQFQVEEEEEEEEEVAEEDEAGMEAEGN